MPVKRLPNIQWQYMRQLLWACLSAVTLGAILFFYAWYALAEIASLKSWMDTQWGWSLPAFPGIAFAFISIVIFWLAAVVVGAPIGYIRGNLLKKRLEVVLQSTLRLERGDLSARIPDLGEDEIGQLGRQLNDMSARFQQQVASLQRLSTTNVELTDQVKQGAILEERHRLARELHDAVSQQLFAISMTMAALKRTFAHNPDKAVQQVALVEEMAVAAQSEMRALLLHLRPAHLEGKSLTQGVGELLSELQGKHTLDFVWSIGELPELPKGVEDHLFRILQEALSNALRHAKAKKIEIKLSVVRQNIRLKITDDGVGFSAEENSKASSYGMMLMRERVAEIGGVLNISSAPGKGTMVEVTVPLVVKE
ncbi:HAMP domain-containing sensor histidine kinase [Numidum massiliense]|uniref:HAMP domain-containing sensor histidine kinase n=1 Tax=Numidum massiliense TaxID=1522315 RepID=UPI0006D54A47|nr:sensor histidine kinase [Numidum massiliense]